MHDIRDSTVSEHACSGDESHPVQSLLYYEHCGCFVLESEGVTVAPLGGLFPGSRSSRRLSHWKRRATETEPPLLLHLLPPPPLLRGPKGYCQWNPINERGIRPEWCMKSLADPRGARIGVEPKVCLRLDDPPTRRDGYPAPTARVPIQWPRGIRIAPTGRCNPIDLASPTAFRRGSRGFLVLFPFRAATHHPPAKCRQSSAIS